MRTLGPRGRVNARQHALAIRDVPLESLADLVEVLARCVVFLDFAFELLEQARVNHVGHVCAVELGCWALAKGTIL